METLVAIVLALLLLWAVSALLGLSLDLLALALIALPRRIASAIRRRRSRADPGEGGG